MKSTFLTSNGFDLQEIDHSLVKYQEIQSLALESLLFTNKHPMIRVQRRLVHIKIGLKSQLIALLVYRLQKMNGMHIRNLNLI